MIHENNGPSGPNTNLITSFEWNGEDDVIRVKFRDSKDELVRRVKPADVERWPKEWAMYEAAREKARDIQGTPLDQIPMMPRETVQALRFRSIHTVEQLAGFDDYAASMLDDERGKGWRDAARMYLLAMKAAGAGSADKAAKQPQKAA